MADYVHSRPPRLHCARGWCVLEEEARELVTTYVLQYVQFVSEDGDLHSMCEGGANRSNGARRLNYAAKSRRAHDGAPGGAQGQNNFIRSLAVSYDVVIAVVAR